MTTVNLRSMGTDVANPKAGILVGTADVEVGVSGWPLLLEVLAFSPEGHRFFVFAPQRFYGPELTPEYVELVATKVPATSASL